MKIRVVSYSKTYQLPLASFFEKIFVQADLDEGEDARKALYECKKVVENFHFESNKAAEKQENVVTPQKLDMETPMSKAARIIKEIKTCTELKVLESYKLIVKNDPDMQAAYDMQFNTITELQNAGL